MILSYHPCFVADHNIICAGRRPDQKDLKTIKDADAVILPQGCYPSLYTMAQENCPNVFPNYDARFNFPGKVGQAQLFKKFGVPHPKTLTFESVDAFERQFTGGIQSLDMKFPLVFKFNWGGEGESVFLIESPASLQELFDLAQKSEKTGHSGFILQEHIPARNRSLRVAVIGNTTRTYWRVQDQEKCFVANLACGGRIDENSDPDIQEQAAVFTRRFCDQTKINLAGFDFLFNPDDKKRQLLFLEINWFFGRKGLGGSETFYNILTTEIRRWLKKLRLNENL